MAALGITTAEQPYYRQLIAGSSEEAHVELKASAGALERGTVLAENTTTGLWEALVPGGSNGTGTARAILAEDVANAAEVQRTRVYFIGKYFWKDLIWPEAITHAQKRSAVRDLRDRGIILDQTLSKVIGETTTTTTT